MTIKNLASCLLLSAFASALSSHALGQEPIAADNDNAETTITTQENNTSSVNPVVNYATSLHLAYVKTSASRINKDCETGLQTLVKELNKRTSVEPAGVAAIDIERDELSFFPFIYWPVTEDAPALSTQARDKLKTYLDNGGFVVFDVHSYNPDLGKSASLKRLLGKSLLGQLERLEKDHTLYKSFYLMDDLRGSKTLSHEWVEATNSDMLERVTPVLIGNKNWAGAWAGKTQTPNTPPYEQAMRAGINMVFFALLGNYKADQLHVPTIMEKMKSKQTP